MPPSTQGRIFIASMVHFPQHLDANQSDMTEQNKQMDKKGMPARDDGTVTRVRASAHPSRTLQMVIESKYRTKSENDIQNFPPVEEPSGGLTPSPGADGKRTDPPERCDVIP